LQRIEFGDWGATGPVQYPEVVDCGGKGMLQRAEFENWDAEGFYREVGDRGADGLLRRAVVGY